MSDVGKYENELAKNNPDDFDGLQRALILQARKYERAFRGCEVIGLEHEFDRRVTETLLAFDKDRRVLGPYAEHFDDPRLASYAPGVLISDLYRCIHCDAPAPDGFEPLRNLTYQEITEEISVGEFRRRYPYFT